jgi:hypothetical protein
MAKSVDNQIQLVIDREMAKENPDTNLIERLLIIRRSIESDKHELILKGIKRGTRVAPVKEIEVPVTPPTADDSKSLGEQVEEALKAFENPEEENASN